MPQILIQAVEHYYEWRTTAADTSRTGKPVMVFVHGWGGSSRYWQSTADYLKPYFDCLLYDLRGFGRSPLPSGHQDSAQDYTMERYAAEFEQLLTDLNLDRIYLNAHSMGASIATLFLAQYGARVEQAILTCSGIFEYNALTFKAFHQVGGWVVRLRPRWLAQIPGANRAFMARFLHRPLPDADSQAFLNDYLLASQAAALGTIYTSVSEHAANIMPEAFAAIDTPTLLISGEFDQIIPAALGQKAVALNPNYVQHQVLERTGHFPMLEDAQTYRERLNRFLALPDQPVMA